MFIRNSYVYILTLVISGLLSSCIQRETYETNFDSEQVGEFVFSAMPSGYVPTHVGTKAGETSTIFDYETFENTIYNAFFLLFDNSGENGTLRVKEVATVDGDNATVSYSIGRDILNVFPTARVCFIANLPASILTNLTVGTTKWSDIENFYFPINYAPTNETKCIGVPEQSDLNADGVPEYALPMFGSQIIDAANINGTFQIDRLLARVEVYLSLGIEDNESLTTLLSEPQFGMDLCEIHNIPKFIPLTSKSVTSYSDITNDAATSQLTSGSYNTYNLDLGENKMLYYSDPNSKEYKSFYFYTPEHKLGDIGSNDSPANKPDLIANTTKRPIYASISGYLVDGDGASYEAKYNIFLGGNSTDDFDLTRNKIYKNYIRINGVENGPDVDHRVEVLDKIEEVVDDVTKSGQSANCYIISTVGTYMLPAYRGAYSDMRYAEMCDVGENAVIACDNPNISITINETLSKQSTIVFDVKLNGSLLSGNAVIARIVEGKIDWSWHLWFIPGIEWDGGSNDLESVNRIGGLQNEDMPDGTTMANRNIGVIGAIQNSDTWLQGTQTGFYYKYGYRQPYFEDKVYGKEKKYHGVNDDNDDSFTAWNDSDGKSITDPCPPGYRVPPISVWTNNHNSATKAHANLYNAFRYWDRGDNNISWGNIFADVLGLNDIYYPYSGYIDEAGNIKKSEGYLEDATKNTFTGSSYYNYKEDDQDGWSDDKRFYKADYYRVDMQLHGYLHSSTCSQNKPIGLNFNATVPILPDTFYYIKKKSKYSWEYNITYSMSANEIEMNDPELYSELCDWLGQRGNLNFSYNISCNQNASLSLSNGYQVRCIKE